MQRSSGFMVYLALPSISAAPLDQGLDAVQDPVQAVRPGPDRARWLRGFAANQPITPVTETVRGLLLGHPAGSHLWLALAWCGGIMIVSAASTAALFQRRTR